MESNQVSAATPGTPPQNPGVQPASTSQNNPDFRQENPFEFKNPPSDLSDPTVSESTQTQPPSAGRPVSTPDQEQPTSPQQDPQTFTQQTTQQQTQEDYDKMQYAAEQYNQESALIPGFTKPVREEVLLEWQAPIRAFKKQNRQVFTTIGIIGLFIGLILFFAGQVIPVAVVFATVFLVYVMYSTPPGMVVHKLTNYGIRVEDTLYYWEEMGRFWFTEKFGLPQLHIEVARFPNRLTLLLGDLSKEDMELILSEVLLQEVPPLTAYEKAAKWLHEKIPINLES